LTSPDVVLVAISALVIAIAAGVAQRWTPPTWDPSVLFASLVQLAQGREPTVRPDVEPWLSWKNPNLADGTRRLGAEWFAIGSSPVLSALAERTQAVRLDAEGLLSLPVGARSRRIVFAAAGDAVPAVLAALKDRAELADRVVAVLSLGGNIGGRDDVDGALGTDDRGQWLRTYFAHEYLDTEVVRLTPYLSVAWTQPGLGLEQQRFPTPIDDEEAMRCVEPVDLGVVPADTEPAVLAEASAFATVLWARSRLG